MAKERGRQESGGRHPNETCNSHRMRKWSKSSHCVDPGLCHHLVRHQEGRQGKAGRKAGGCGCLNTHCCLIGVVGRLHSKHWGGPCLSALHL